MEKIKTDYECGELEKCRLIFSRCENRDVAPLRYQTYQKDINLVCHMSVLFSTQEAMKHFSQAIKYDPYHANSYFNLGTRLA